MHDEIPLFPLNIVAFPGELVNLHIFEPRYKDLVSDCIDENKNFGIPTYDGKTMSHGTEVEILKVEKVYKDGRMDIRTKGQRIFELEEFYDPWRDKTYAGGRVLFQENGMSVKEETREKMLELAKQLFDWLNMNEKFRLDKKFLSYSLAHKVGLKLDEELELLKMFDENERQVYLTKHLENLLPALERAEQAKERIMMNGHFKHLAPPEF